MGFFHKLICGALAVLTGVLGVPSLAAKLLVEVASFTVSWLLQNRLVFQQKRR